MSNYKIKWDFNGSAIVFYDEKDNCIDEADLGCLAEMYIETYLKKQLESNSSR